MPGLQAAIASALAQPTQNCLALLLPFASEPRSQLKYGYSEDAKAHACDKTGQELVHHYIAEVEIARKKEPSVTIFAGPQTEAYMSCGGTLDGKHNSSDHAGQHARFESADQEHRVVSQIAQFANLCGNNKIARAFAYDSDYTSIDLVVLAILGIHGYRERDWREIIRGHDSFKPGSIVTFWPDGYQEGVLCHVLGSMQPTTVMHCVFDKRSYAFYRGRHVTNPATHWSHKVYAADPTHVASDLMVTELQMDGETRAQLLSSANPPSRLTAGKPALHFVDKDFTRSHGDSYLIHGLSVWPLQIAVADLAAVPSFKKARDQLKHLWSTELPQYLPSKPAQQLNPHARVVDVPKSTLTLSNIEQGSSSSAPIWPSKKKKKPASDASTSPESPNVELNDSKPTGKSELDSIRDLGKAAAKWKDKEDAASLRYACIMFKQQINKAESLLKTYAPEAPERSEVNRLLSNAHFTVANLEKPLDLAEAKPAALKATEEHLIKSVLHGKQVDNTLAGDGTLPFHLALAYGGLVELKTANLEYEPPFSPTLTRSSIKEAQNTPLTSTKDLQDATPFVLIAQALEKLEEAINKFKVALLLSLKPGSEGSEDMPTLARDQAKEAASSLQMAYEAPSHFIYLAASLKLEDKIAIDDHIAELAKTFPPGAEGISIQAEAVLDVAEALVDCIESRKEELKTDEEGDASDEAKQAEKEGLEQLQSSETFTAALNYLRRASKLYEEALQKPPEGMEDQLKFQLGTALSRLEDMLPEGSAERDDISKELAKMDLNASDEEWEDEDEDEES